MNTFIALLRGVNVGGHKKVPMAQLRELLKNAGLNNVETYIQSGNVIFKSSEEIATLEGIIQKAIQTHFGFDVSVLVKTPQQLQLILDNCPFPKEKKEQSYFTLMNKIPDKEKVREIDKVSYPGEEFVIKEDCLYFYCATGYGRTKFNNNFFEKKLDVTATARNFRTILKLLSLSSELEQ